MSQSTRRNKRSLNKSFLKSPKHFDVHNSIDTGVYHRFDAIEEYLKSMANKHPSIFSLEAIEVTDEGRSIYLVKIGRSALGGETPSVLIDGGMHAREWSTVATAIQTIANIINMFTRQPDSCLETLVAIDWYILPILNPDGYEFSHTTDRMWRKNRRAPPASSDCKGVDINRNFPLGYGLGSEDLPCSEVYRGTEAASEPETRAIMTSSTRLNGSLLYYISLHAYGQSWLTPYGYTTEEMPDYGRHERLALDTFKQMDCTFGETVPAKEWEVGSAAVTYYIAGGASDDWVYKYTGAVSYTIEVADDGREFGFLLPSQRIKELSEDLWVAFRHLALSILAE